MIIGYVEKGEILCYIVDTEEEEHELYSKNKLGYGKDCEVVLDAYMIKCLKEGKTLLFNGGEYYTSIKNQ